MVGTDKYGNKYLENDYYFYGRNRWVEYAPHFNMDYDASQIPAEWYGWMHYKVSLVSSMVKYSWLKSSVLFSFQTDKIPTEDGRRPQYKWMSDHSQNLSGTPGKNQVECHSQKAILNSTQFYSRSIHAIHNNTTKNRSMDTTEGISVNYDLKQNDNSLLHTKQLLISK